MEIKELIPKLEEITKQCEMRETRSIKGGEMEKEWKKRKETLIKTIEILKEQKK